MLQGQNLYWIIGVSAIIALASYGFVKLLAGYLYTIKSKPQKDAQSNSYTAKLLDFGSRNIPTLSIGIVCTCVLLAKDKLINRFVKPEYMTKYIAKLPSQTELVIAGILICGLSILYSELRYKAHNYNRSINKAIDEYQLTGVTNN